MQKFERVAVIAKPQGAISRYVRELTDLITRTGCTPYLDENAAAHMPSDCPFESGSAEEIARVCDVAVAIGGDGTMLGAARAMAAYKVPVIGINAGRLGFITDIVLEDMNRLLPAMLLGQYVADERSMLEGSVWREGNMLFEGLAVNDIGISHGRALGMVEYTVYVDGLQMAVQRADGVLVSTSTGSTAYAMAAGGPIMHRDLPSSPTRRSSDLEVNETRSAVASFDAQVLIDVQAGDVLRVKVSKERFTMLHPVGYNHFDLLRRKLKWNYLPQSEHPIHTPLQDQTTPVQIPHPTTSEKSSD